jgi:serine/threonine protein kinase
VLDGKYRLERELGRGGMGAVHLATHLGTDRPVAVKVIAPRFAARPEFVERFRREARAAGRLRHPNVVDVTDFGVAELDGGRVPYIVMELLDGRTLGALLREERALPLAWAVDLLEQACAALEAAHRRGIVHRDLKPDNLWLEPDARGGFTVKVLDFGLARLAEPGAPARPEAAAPRPAASDVTAPAPADGDEEETLARTPPAASASAGGADTAELTRAGDVLGTPAYMSPEQCRGEVPEARSDVYALGVIAYRVLAGATPFTGDAAAVMAAHVAQPPPALAVPGVPRAVGDLVAQALAKDPAQRPPSAAAFGAALRARAERPAAFLRHAVTLTAAAWSPLSRASLIVHGPGFLAAAAVGALAAATTGTAGLRVPLAAAAVVVSLATMAALAAVGALAEAVMLQALVAPRRPPSMPRIVARLRSRVRPYARTVLPYFVAPLLPALFTFAPRSPATRLAAVVAFVAAFAWMFRNVDAFWFVAQAVVTEGRDGRGGRERSRHLARLMRAHLSPLERASSGLVMGALLLVVAAAFAGARAAAQILDLGAGGTLAAGLALATLGSALAAPLISVSYALLYFRTREAAGEPLAEVLGGLDATTSAQGRPIDPPSTAG